MIICLNSQKMKKLRWSNISTTSNLLSIHPIYSKAFTKKGLWMLATILSSKQAKETTFLIIETFDKIDNLKYNLKLLETTSDNKIKEQLSQKSGEIIVELLEVPEEYDTDTETVEVNFGLLKYKRTVKKVHKKENAKDAKN